MQNDLNNFKKLIKARSFREPIAYLTNKNFLGVRIFVTKDTLIPRPDTEIIVENVLNLTKYKTRLNILDIGVGSGCVLLSILKEKQNFMVQGLI